LFLLHLVEVCRSLLQLLKILAQLFVGGGQRLKAQQLNLQLQLLRFGLSFDANLAVLFDQLGLSDALVVVVEARQ